MSKVTNLTRQGDDAAVASSGSCAAGGTKLHENYLSHKARAAATELQQSRIQMLGEATAQEPLSDFVQL